MRGQTIVKIGVGVAVMMALLAAGAIVAFRSVNLDQVKEVLTTQVKSATGRTLTIAGPLELRLGLMPSMVAKGVTLSNPAGSTRPEMVKIGAFEMEVALMPLLQQEIVVNRLIVTSPDILIETEAKGPGNLDFGPPTEKSEAQPGAPEPPPAESGTAYRLTVKELAMTNGMIAWHDRASRKTESMEIQELTVRHDRASAGLLALHLLTKVRNQNVELNGTVGKADALLGGQPWPVNLTAQLQGIVINVAGSIADLTALRGLQLKVAAQGPELIEAARLAGMTKPEWPPSAGPFTFAANLSGSGTQLHLTDVAITAGKADLILLNAKGTIKDLTGAAAVDLAVTVASDHPGAAAQLAGAAYAGKGPVHLAGQLQGSDKNWKMTGLKATAGESDLNGELAAQLAVRPKLTGKLTSATFNLADVTAQAAPAAPGKSPVQPARDKGGEGRVFPDDPLPVAILRVVDADLAVQVDKLILDGKQLVDVAMTMRLNNGRLTVKPFRLGLADGVLEGEATLDASGKTPVAALRMNGRQVEIGRLDSKGPISGGRSDIKVDLKSSGESVRALMASATGETSVSVGEGKLRNKAVDLAAGDLMFQVLGALNPFAKSEDTTRMVCAAVRFVIRDGVATAADKGIAMRTSNVDMVGSGTVDLRTERLDLAIKPRPRGGVGLSLTTPLAGMVKVGGTIAKPSVGIDTAGTLKTAASVGAGIATGGLSTVGEMLFDKVTADEDPCRTALGQTQRGQAKPKTETPQKQRSGGFLQEMFGR